MANNVIQYDFEEFCRVCMNRNLNMKPLFDVTNNIIIGKIEFCTGIVVLTEDLKRKRFTIGNTLKRGVKFKPEVGHPTKICKVCLRNLSIAHKFKTTCLQSDQVLREHVSTIKVGLTATDRDEVNHTTNDDFNEFNNSDEDITKLNSSNNARHETEDGVHRSKLECHENGVVCSKNMDDCKEQLSVDKTEKQKKPLVRLKKYKFRKLYCESCDIKFEDKVTSDAHRRKVHMEDAGWVCEICGKNFVHRASLHTHVRSHQPPQHACDRCDYRTTNKYDLAKHLRIHTGEKQYQCGACSASYRTASNLRQHARRLHEAVRPFACPRASCARAFHDRTKLNRHIDSHDQVKRHVCAECGAAFTRRCYWKRHLQRQHGVLVPRVRPGRHKENLQVHTK